METAKQINDLSNWVDDYPVNKARDPEAQLWGRVSKLYEEKEEVMAAMIGYTGQNPRKGITHERDDIRKELFDVALTALGAVAHLDYNSTDVVKEFFEHIAKVHERAGLNDD